MTRLRLGILHHFDLTVTGHNYGPRVEIGMT